MKTVEDGYTWYTCDRCKVRHEMADADLQVGVNWPGDSWGAVDATAVARTTGSSWPEGTRRESVEWHLCPKCFEEWLKPILVEECGEGEVSTTEF